MRRNFLQEKNSILLYLVLLKVIYYHPNVCSEEQMLVRHYLRIEVQIHGGSHVGLSFKCNLEINFPGTLSVFFLMRTHFLSTWPRGHSGKHCAENKLAISLLLNTRRRRLMHINIFKWWRKRDSSSLIQTDSKSSWAARHGLYPGREDSIMRAFCFGKQNDLSILHCCSYAPTLP